LAKSAPDSVDGGWAQTLQGDELGLSEEVRCLVVDRKCELGANGEDELIYVVANDHSGDGTDDVDSWDLGVGVVELPLQTNGGWGRVDKGR
jgi:hypothetical protein